MHVVALVADIHVPTPAVLELEAAFAGQTVVAHLRREATPTRAARYTLRFKIPPHVQRAIPNGLIRFIGFYNILNGFGMETGLRQRV